MLDASLRSNKGLLYILLFTRVIFMFLPESSCKADWRSCRNAKVRNQIMDNNLGERIK